MERPNGQAAQRDAVAFGNKNVRGNDRLWSGGQHAGQAERRVVKKCGVLSANIDFGAGHPVYLCQAAGVVEVAVGQQDGLNIF